MSVQAFSESSESSKFVLNPSYVVCTVQAPGHKANTFTNPNGLQHTHVAQIDSHLGRVSSRPGRHGVSVRSGVFSPLGRGWACRRDRSSRPIQEGSRSGTREVSVQPDVDALRGRGWTCKHGRSSHPMHEGSRPGTREVSVQTGVYARQGARWACRRDRSSRPIQEGSTSGI